MDEICEHGIQWSFNHWKTTIQNIITHENLVKTKTISLLRYLARNKKQILYECYKKWQTYMIESIQLRGKYFKANAVPQNVVCNYR